MILGILRAVMFSAFMAMLFCSKARRENRRIACYVTVFAPPLADKRARQKTENVAARSIYSTRVQIAAISPSPPGEGRGEGFLKSAVCDRLL